MSEVTHRLEAIDAGDAKASDHLLPPVYDELRKLAATQMAREKPGQTLDATDLVHKAWLRLIGDQRFNSRGHFMSAAAEAMRRILVEQARRKGRDKRGGGRKRIDLDLGCPVAEAPDRDLEALDEALTRLAARDPARAELVKLRFFAGLTMPEAAAVLGVSLATAEHYWTFARTWPCAELTDPE